VILTEKEIKLLRLSLDRCASSPERANAAARLVASLVARGIDGYAIEAALDERTKVVEAPRYNRHSPEVLLGEMLLDFGKHKGKKLKSVPHDYLRWALEDYGNLSRPMRRAFTQWLAFIYANRA
jgi:hypothetical protein